MREAAKQLLEDEKLFEDLKRLGVDVGSEAKIERSLRSRKDYLISEMARREDPVYARQSEPDCITKLENTELRRK